MKKFKMQTLKLEVSGEYESEEQAIKELADAYMQRSKCDPPGQSIPEIMGKAINIVSANFSHTDNAVDALTGKSINPIDAVFSTPIAKRNVENISKRVWFYVEDEIYGNAQYVLKYRIRIYPFKTAHWWESEDSFEFKEREFKYEIITD